MEGRNGARILVVSTHSVFVRISMGVTVIHYSLKNHEADQEVDEMFNMGLETMNLPMEEKMKFEQGDSGQSFGSVTFTDLENQIISLFLTTHFQI